MGLFSRKSAEALDDTAAAMHRAGTRFGGDKGGRAADTVASTTLGPIRSRIDEDCTRCARGKCKSH